VTDIAILTREEAIALDDCEKRIESGLKTFLEVGSALAVIRDSKLYRETHETFEAYAKERWNLSRTRSYELMAAADVVSAIADTGQVPPENEAQARQLSRLPEADRADVWAETVERTNGKPTAAAVREVSEEQRKRAEEQRDAREHLRQIVELAWSPNWPEGHVEHWAQQLGPYDDELSNLVDRATKAISVLDGLIEGAGL
jgi:hypothetical protein